MLTLLVVLGVSVQVGAEPVETAVEEADRLAASGDENGALAWLVRTADGWIAAGRLGEAEQILTAAVERFPRAGTAWSMLGRARLLEGRYEDGLGALEQAIELGVGDVRTLLYLGSAFWETGAPRAAEEAFRRAMTASGGDVLPTHQLGRLLLWQGRYGEAVEVLRRAVDGGDSLVMRYDLAQAELGAGRTAAAVETFGEVVKAEPRYSRAYWGLGRALARLGRREEAEVALETFRRLYEADQAATRDAGLAAAAVDGAHHLVVTGDPEGALARLESQPHSVDVLLARARALIAMGREAAAMEALEKVLAHEPDRVDVRRLLDEVRLSLEEAG